MKLCVRSRSTPPPTDPTGRQTCRLSLRLSLLDGCMCDAAHFCWLTSHTQELQEAPKPLKCLYFTMAWTYLRSASCVRQQWSTKRDLKGHRERSCRPIERYGRVRDSPPAPRTLSVPPPLLHMNDASISVVHHNYDFFKLQTWPNYPSAFFSFIKRWTTSFLLLFLYHS